MKIYLAIKYHSDNSNREFIEELINHLSQQGHKVTCVVRDVERWGEKMLTPFDLMQKSFELIDESDLVLVELSEKGVGIGIEAGYSFCRKKPLVTIAKKGSDISTTIKGISDRILEYSKVSEINIEISS